VRAAAGRERERKRAAGAGCPSWASPWRGAADKVSGPLPLR